MGIIFTRERLLMASSVAASYDEVIEYFGLVPTPGRRRHVKARLRAEGVDTSPLDVPWVRHSEERLRELAAASTSIAEVVRRLGISPVGGNHAHIARRMAHVGVDTSHFVSPPHGRDAPGRSRSSGLVLGSPSQGRVRGARLRALMLSHGMAELCTMCHTGTLWHGRPLRLEVDHVNGDWWDNRPTNLRFLCPNCHAVTDTYRGRKNRSTDGDRG